MHIGIPHIPSILGISNRYRTQSTESIAVLAAEILRVLGVCVVQNPECQQYPQYGHPRSIQRRCHGNWTRKYYEYSQY